MSYPNKTKTLELALTIKTGAYVSGRVVGGLLDLNLMCGGGGGGMGIQVVVSDAANQKKALKLYLFDGKPTEQLDDAVFGATFVIGDINKLVAVIDVEAAKYVTLNSLAYNIIGAPPDTNKYGISHGTGALYVYLVTNDTPTYGAANALTLKITGWKD